MASLEITRLAGFGRGKKQSFAGGDVTLGTDAASLLRFDPTWDKTVAPRHAVLRWQGVELWLEDLGSRDGTWLSGRRVQKEKLVPGTVLELGKGGPTVKLDWVPEAAPVDAITTTMTRATPGASAAAQPQPASRSLAPSATAPRSRSVPSWVYVAAVILVLALLGGALWRWQRASGNADERLAAVAREYEAAVGLVVVVHPGLNGGQPMPMATAWAAGERLFVTNSHVTETAKLVLDKGGSAFVVLNRHPDRHIRILSAKIHPRYGEKELNFEGKTPAVPAYDVGLLRTEESAPVHFRIASYRELERVDSGYRVAYLGFPMENMAGGGVEVRNPVATMQSGIVTSATDYWLAKAPFEKRLLIQHNLAAAGGSSGSPVFNADGEVVGVLSAGNVIGAVTLLADGKAQVTRAPSAALVNFAQRADLLGQLDPELQAK